MNKDFVRVQTCFGFGAHRSQPHQPISSFGVWAVVALRFRVGGEFPQQASCPKNAEQELAALYQQAERKFHACTDGRAPNGFLLRSKARV